MVLVAKMTIVDGKQLGDSKERFWTVNRGGLLPCWFCSKTFVITISENWKLIRRMSVTLLPVRNLHHRHNMFKTWFSGDVDKTGWSRWEDWSWPLPAMLWYSSSESTLPKRVFCCIVTSLRRLLSDVWCVFWWTDWWSFVNSVEVCCEWACTAVACFCSVYSF